MAAKLRPCRRGQVVRLSMAAPTVTALVYRLTESAAAAWDIRGDRRRGRVGQILGYLGVDVHGERHGRVPGQLADAFAGCPAARSIEAVP
jgi:hypothetical protein